MWQKALTGLVMLAILLVAAAYIILVRGEAERPAPEVLPRRCLSRYRFRSRTDGRRGPLIH